MAHDRSDIANIQQTFVHHADDYERRIGGATRAVAAHFVSHLDLPSSPVVLDSGCGTAGATEAVLKKFHDANVHAVDISQGMIDVVQSKIQKHETWTGKVEAAVMDGEHLKFKDDFFDLSITNFSIFFYHDPERGAREIHRTLKKGGTAVVTTWKLPGLVELLYEVQKVVKPATPIESMPVLERWKEKSVLESCMQKGGFANVEFGEKEVMIGGENDGGTYHGSIEMLKGFIGDRWSEQEKKKLPEAIASLSKKQQHHFFVKEKGMEGVKLVAWIAKAKK